MTEKAINTIALLAVLALTLSPAAALSQTLTGTVGWEQRLEIGPLVGGVVLRASPEVGDRIEKGVELLRLDPAPYEHKVAMAEAQVAASKTEYESMRQQHDRETELYDIGSLSTVSLQETSYALTRAEAAFTLAQARLELARYDLDKTTLSAPFDLWVVEKHVFEGQSLSTAQTIPVSYVVAPVGRYVVEVRGQDDSTPLPPAGAVAEVKAGGNTYQGRVTFPRDSAKIEAGLLTVRFRDEDRLIMPGTAAAVSVIE